MKKNTFYAVTAFIALSALNLNAADNFFRRNAINLSYSGLNFEYGVHPIIKENTTNLQIDFNHKLNSYWGIGVYSAFGLFTHYELTTSNTSTQITSTEFLSGNSVQYGINSKLHILPLLFKNNQSKLDFYVLGTAGVIAINSSAGENIVPIRGNYFDYSLMGGGAIYLSKALGLFVEAGYRNFEYHHGLNARYGLTVQF